MFSTFPGRARHGQAATGFATRLPTTRPNEAIAALRPQRLGRRRPPSRLVLVVDLCYPSLVGVGVPCEVDATLLVRCKGEFLTTGSMTPTTPLQPDNGTVLGRPDKASAYSFVGGFAV